MAVDIKVAPDEKLELVQTYITDTTSNSDYFNVSELPDTFSGGKNAFLIAGTDKLLANTEIKIQIRDANGNVCYVEYSNGNPEYYEGNSKVAAVYVYPTLTAFGPATITILGQLKDVPQEWNGLYSVKWQKQVNINPALANTTRVRFYKRPAVTIKELLQPLYSIVSGSKVASLVTQSFASITVNQLETFAGDVARVKVFRTSAGDISDYDLIQDISIEAKNLLTTYELTGSVVGNAGLFGPDSLKNVWNTSSLHAVLDSTYINDGLQLTGSGTFTYSASLNLLSSNTYELELDSYFTGSTLSSGSNLGIYVSYPTQSLIGQPYTSTTTIAILSGSIPVKSFGTQTFPFNVPFDYPTASLYFSQSSGTNQWHIGNISLNLSQDTAFSPNEVSFITSMPTVLGNETFNFKFEFYDINNNYVPVAVIQSALFNGGNNNIGGTLLIVSGSTSASNAAILALSQSVSGTISNVSQSVSSSISHSIYTSSVYTNNVSASISGTIASVSQSVNTSINLVSGSFSSSLNILSGGVVILSQSVSSSLYELSSSISSLSASISNSISNSTFTIYSASAYLDKFIFTDENGKLNKTPATGSENGLFLGSTYLGFYDGGVWKTYMDGQGDFYLTGSNNNFLAWNSTLGTLQVQGTINIQGGNAATTTSLNSATASLLSTINTTSQSLSASLAPNIFTDSNGQVQRPPNVLVGSSQGLFLGSTNLGFYSGSSWKTYMDNQGKFYLTGSTTDGFSNYLTWDGAGGLTVAGNINIVGSNSNIYTQTEINTISASVSASAYRAYLSASVYSSSFSSSLSSVSSSLSSSAYGAYTSASSYSGSEASARLALSGSTATSISASNALAAAYSASISASTAATTALLDGKIFTDANGRVVKTPNASVAGLFLGNDHLGFYDGGVWKTYMDNQGKFYLTGSVANGYSNYLVWDGAGGLTIAGAINIVGGTAATQIANAASSGSNALTYAITNNTTASVAAASNAATYALTNANTASITAAGNAATYALSNANTASIFTSAAGAINKAATPSGAGLYLGSSYLGYYNGSAWKTYMANNGDFYLSGAGSNGLTWNSGTSTLSIDGNITARNGTFIGNITSTATISGGTISGGTISGGTIRIGSGTSVFSADTNGIYLGNGTYSSAPFRVSPSGVLTATNATITGNINATGGSIGGWQVDNIGQLIGSSSTGQIVLNPTAPNFNFLDSYGDTKLNLKIGALTNPESPNNVSFTINSNYASAYSQNTSGTDYVYGTTTSVYVPAAGTYTGNAKYNWGSSYIQYQTNSQFYGYLYISCYITILDSDGYAVGTTYVNSIDSFGPSDSGTVYGGVTYAYPSFSFPKAGTYTIKPTIEITRQLSSGYFDYTISQQSQGSLTYNQAVSLSEISDYGLVIANDANDYITMNRQGYKINLKGTVYFSSQYTGQYSYCDGVWHPFSGNKNDLGTSGNRWRTVWTNNNLNISDERLKNSIEDTDLGLEFVNKLKPKRFKYNESLTPRYHYGFVAQEISASLSEYGHSSSDVSFINTSSVEYTNEQIEELKTKPNWESVQRDIAYQEAGYMGLNYTELISPMIKAIQELSDRVIYLESQLSGSI